MRRFLYILLAFALPAVQAFVAPHSRSFTTSPSSTIQWAAKPHHSNNHDNHNMLPIVVPTIATTAFWTATATVAQAAGPDWGIFEGRTGSLLHPIMMGGLLIYSCYTAFLGFQWRRQRTIGDVIKEKQALLPSTGESATVADALAAAKEGGADAAVVSQLQSGLAVEQEIKELQQTRKDLAAAGPRDRHYAQGAVLACLGTLFAIEGPLNTYARAGKLFPGPHLYAGAGLVCLWAIAAATVPYMQKGNDTARSIHIGANVAGLALFAWQVQSGLPILFKVIELTKWP